jgi:hypothetical protein
VLERRRPPAGEAGAQPVGRQRWEDPRGGPVDVLFEFIHPRILYGKC